ncbi:MAG: hypothetical protein AB7P03_20035 [Kofleriaceae bacterium]
MKHLLYIAVLLTSAVGVASADDSEVADDGYCDYVQGVASAESAVLLGPEVFSQFGLIEQSPGTVNPDEEGGYRFIVGARVRLDGIYKGLAIRDRARADCRRHKALEQVRGETVYQALAAKAKVLDAAVQEAEKILKEVDQDLDARRTTAQEATATRLRIEELRTLATDTHREMGLLPQSTGELTGALTAFQSADDDVERISGKLRRAQAFDVSFRVGVDQFLNREDANPSPIFAVVAVGVNLGVLFQGSGNSRALEGRRRLIRSGRDPVAVEASADRLHATVEVETKRAQDAAALETDLQRQLDTLRRLGGDDSKRYRQTVWFEWVKIRAERAYLDTHLRALRQVLGEVAQ